MHHAKHWKLEPVMNLLLWLFAGMFLGAVLIAGLPKLIGPGMTTPSPDLQFLNHLIGAATFHGWVLWLAWRFVRAQGMTWNQAFGFEHGSARKVALFAAAATALALPVSLALGELSSLVMTRSDLNLETQQTVRTLQQTRGLFERVVFGFSAIVLAPAAEELLFRGILYPVLKALGFPRLAFWGTAVVFAAIHANLPTFLSLTAFALILSSLYERTQNLLAPILAHSLFNAVNFCWILSAAS